MLSPQISSNWALSAAHCYRHGTHDTIAADIRLVLGDHDRIQDNTLRSIVHWCGASPDAFRLRKVVPVIQIVNHPDFLRPTFENDLALLRLHESVDLNTYTPVCLPEVGADFTGRKGWVYG